jgi:hypothetical protein
MQGILNGVEGCMATARISWDPRECQRPQVAKHAAGLEESTGAENRMKIQDWECKSNAGTHMTQALITRSGRSRNRIETAAHRLD